MQDISFLVAFRTMVDFFFLTFSLWLGFFIITRSPRSKVSWLAGAALWGLSASFLSHLVSLHSSVLNAREIWWWGWSIALAVSFWYHTSVTLLPDRRAVKRQGLISLIYLLALNLVAMDAYTPWIFDRGLQQRVSEASSLVTGPLYPLFAAFLIIVPLLSIDNLRLGLRSAKSESLRQRLRVLIWASAFAFWGSLWGGLTTWLAPELNGFVSDMSLGIAVLLLGYGVARWNALIEGRAVRLDFLYTSVVFGFVVGIYLLAAWLSKLLFNVPLLAFLMLVVLAVITHSIYDRTRYQLDRWIFGRHRSQQFLESLRKFSRAAPLERDMPDRLKELFQTLCHNLTSSRGFIALCEGEKWVPISQVGIQAVIESGDALNLKGEEIQRFSPPRDFMGVDQIALLAPLRFGEQVLGILALGRRSDGTQYSDGDITILEYFADIVAAVVHTVQLQEQNLEQIESLFGEVHRLEGRLQQQMREAMGVEAEPMRWLAQNETESIAQVEDALRHLHDYSYLGSQRLANLHIVDAHIDIDEAESVTHIDRGKALRNVLICAIEKLMPAAERMHSTPSREWYPYVILHDCYLLGKRNRDVMAALYISEGTFNRTRRRALRSTTRALVEMEHEAQRSASVG